jgi:hypothetical protein
MDDIAKATFAFSKLTEINSKRSARYTAAADKVKNIHLKIVFMNYAFQAQQLNADLKRWIMAYGVQTMQSSDSIFSVLRGDEELKIYLVSILKTVFSAHANNWKKKR